MKFIATMLEEKNLMDETVEVEVEGLTHYMPVEVIVEFIEQMTNGDTRQSIKRRMSAIDFRNGDMMNFLEYLAKGFIEL